MGGYERESGTEGRLLWEAEVVVRVVWSHSHPLAVSRAGAPHSGSLLHQPGPRVRLGGSLGRRWCGGRGRRGRASPTSQVGAVGSRCRRPSSRALAGRPTKAASPPVLHRLQRSLPHFHLKASSPWRSERSLRASKRLRRGAGMDPKKLGSHLRPSPTASLQRPRSPP